MKKLNKTVCVLFTMTLVAVNVFSQVKSEEIVLTDKTGKPTLINFKQTKLESNKRSVEVFLKKQYNLNNLYSFKKKIFISQQ